MVTSGGDESNDNRKTKLTQIHALFDFLRIFSRVKEFNRERLRLKLRSHSKRKSKSHRRLPLN